MVNNFKIYEKPMFVWEGNDLENLYADSIIVNFKKFWTHLQSEWDSLSLYVSSKYLKDEFFFFLDYNLS